MAAGLEARPTTCHPLTLSLPQRPSMEHQHETRYSEPFTYRSTDALKVVECGLPTLTVLERYQR